MIRTLRILSIGFLIVAYSVVAVCALDCLAQRYQAVQIATLHHPMPSTHHSGCALPDGRPSFPGSGHPCGGCPHAPGVKGILTASGSSVVRMQAISGFLSLSGFGLSVQIHHIHDSPLIPEVLVLADSQVPPTPLRI